MSTFDRSGLLAEAGENDRFVPRDAMHCISATRQHSFEPSHFICPIRCLIGHM